MISFKKNMAKLKPAPYLLICMTLSALTLTVSCSWENPDEASADNQPVNNMVPPETGALSGDPAQTLLSTLDTREKVGQLLFIDLWTDEGHPILEVTDSLAAQLRDLNPGGVVFYGANLKNPEQVREFAESMTAALRVPPFLAVDHEGGIVNRLNHSGNINATPLPSAAAVGKTGKPELAYRIGLVMGRELLSLGLNINFAPVADVISSADSFIGPRSYGSDPALVAEMVKMTVLGLQEAGVSSVVKHFPGHGGCVGDTHTGTVYLDREIDELFSRELLPFAAGVDAGADGVMAAHIILGAPGSDGLPATVSPDLLTGVLRRRLGFDGLIITDSLHMKALSEVERPAVDAIRAGADMLLTPRDKYAARAQILSALKDGSLSLERIEESALRIIRIKLERGIGIKHTETPADVLGSEPHRQVVSEIQRFHSSGE